MSRFPDFDNDEPTDSSFTELPAKEDLAKEIASSLIGHHRSTDQETCDYFPDYEVAACNCGLNDTADHIAERVHYRLYCMYQELQKARETLICYTDEWKKCRCSLAKDSMTAEMGARIEQLEDQFVEARAEATLWKDKARTISGRLTNENTRLKKQVEEAREAGKLALRQLNGYFDLYPLDHDLGVAIKRLEEVLDSSSPAQ